MGIRNIYPFVARAFEALRSVLKGSELEITWHGDRKLEMSEFETERNTEAVATS